MVLAAGLLTLDVISVGDNTFHSVGGTAGNVAAMSSWLGCPSAIAARVGIDAAGAAVEADLGRLGVDLSLLEREPSETMRVVHRIEPRGHSFSMRCPACERRLPRHRRLTTAQVERVAAQDKRFSAVLIDQATPALARLATRWAAIGKRVVFEPWRPPATAVLAPMLAAAHIVKVSGTRALVASLDAAPRRPGGIDIVTLGADGLRWRVNGGPWATLSAPRGDAVDPAGAGDWLTSALLYSDPRTLGEDPRELEDQLARAQAIASLSIRYPGALGMLRALQRADLDELLLDGRPTPPPTTAKLTRVKASSGSCSVCLRPSS